MNTSFLLEKKENKKVMGYVAFVDSCLEALSLILIHRQ